MNKQTINPDDFDVLFSGSEIQIGKTTYTITPMNVGDFAAFIREVKSVLPVLIKRKITFANCFSAKLGDLIEVIVEHAPKALSIMTGFDKADIVKMPFAVVFRLAETAINVNFPMTEGLEKNLQALTGRLMKIIAGENMLRVSESENKTDIHGASEI